MNKALYTHMTPVMLGEMTSGDFWESLRPASTNPQFATGPQKCVVFGPVGELMNAFKAGSRPVASFAAILHDV